MVCFTYLISAAQWSLIMKGLCSTPCTACQPHKGLKWWCRVRTAHPATIRGMAGLLIGSNQIILSNSTCSGKGCSDEHTAADDFFTLKFYYLKQWEGRNTASSEVLDAVSESHRIAGTCFMPWNPKSDSHTMEHSWKGHFGPICFAWQPQISHQLQTGCLKYDGACEGHQYLQ